MPSNHRDPANLSYAALIGTTVTVVFITVIVIWADLYAPLKDWLKMNFSHHWVGKGILSTIVFFLSGAFVVGGRQKSESDVAKVGQSTFVVTVSMAFVLLLFFLYDAFFKQ